jgi:hypothetical protein
MSKEEQLLEYWRELSTEEKERVLEFTQSLQANRNAKEPKEVTVKERIWQAYLESEQENQEVYQHLANS